VDLHAGVAVDVHKLPIMFQAFTLFENRAEQAAEEARGEFAVRFAGQDQRGDGVQGKSRRQKQRDVFARRSLKYDLHGAYSTYTRMVSPS